MGNYFRFHVPGMTKELEKLWEYGAYAEAVSIITYEGTWEVKEAWYERVFEILPRLRGEGFRDACHTISAVKDYPNVHAGRLREALNREDLDRNDRTRHSPSSSSWSHPGASFSMLN